MVKNTRQDTGKYKTIIKIDDQNVFTSPAYEWKHPDEDETEFDVSTGIGCSDLKGAVRNISITCFE